MTDSVEISDSTQKLVFLFIDDFDEKKLNHFVDNILIKNREGMVKILSNLTRYSQSYNQNEKEALLDSFNRGSSFNFTNKFIADMLKTFSKERSALKKLRSKYVDILNAVVLKRLEKKAGTLSIGKTKSIKNDVLTSIGIPVQPFHSVYLCHNTMMVVVKDRLLESFDTVGIPTSGKIFPINEGWGYDKVAQHECEFYIRSL